MTLNEAMVDLSIQSEVKRRLGKNHEAESIGLGIEALIFRQQWEEMDAEEGFSLLPGETKE